MSLKALWGCHPDPGWGGPRLSICPLMPFSTDRPGSMKPLGAPGSTKQHPPPAMGPPCHPSIEVSCLPPKKSSTHLPGALWELGPGQGDPKIPREDGWTVGGTWHPGDSGDRAAMGPQPGDMESTQHRAQLYPVLGRVGGYWCGTGATCWAEGTVPPPADPKSSPKSGGGACDTAGVPPPKSLIPPQGKGQSPEDWWSQEVAMGQGVPAPSPPRPPASPEGALGCQAGCWQQVALVGHGPATLSPSWVLGVTNSYRQIWS